MTTKRDEKKTIREKKKADASARRKAKAAQRKTKKTTKAAAEKPEKPRRKTTKSAAKRTKSRTKSQVKENIDQFLLSLNKAETRKTFEKLIQESLDSDKLSDLGLKKIGLAVLENIYQVKSSLTKKAEEVEKKVRKNKTLQAAKEISEKTQKRIAKAKETLDAIRNKK